MSNLIADLTHDFRTQKTYADKAIAPLSDEAFFQRPGPAVNPIALVVKHLAGNLQSRWSDVLTTDGEKPTRDRDAEFVLDTDDTRENLLAAWERGWGTLFHTLSQLTDADLAKTVTIRGEPHTLQQALIRGFGHGAYHVGQIMYLARLFNADAPYQTIAPGKSKEHRPGYRKA